ncbi:MAG: RsmB/NOP family class I SAM-dependent RNA methyltransferase [Candidatus Coprovivens sp.]
MLPDFLKEKITNEYDEKQVKIILETFSKSKIVSLRINTIKSTKEEITKYLEEQNITYETISWSENALVITNKTEEDLRNLDIYKAGKIYLQSLSSQLPPLFLNPQDNEMILDMTAAPGGKTTEIAALSNNKAMITAIEKNKIRSEKLRYNIDKQGAKKVTVLNTDARNLNEYFMFDKILLDSPCSGSGTFTNNNFDNFSEDLVNRSTNFQKSLLTEAIKHLKVGGEIIYSTCSILKEENEEIINYILSKNNNIEIVYLDLSEYSDIPKLPVTIEGTLCVMPSKYYEGFYVAKLKKIN